MGTVKGVIFDMDGVIFDSERVWKRAFEEANGVFGTQFTEEDRQRCCGKDEKTIRKELKQENPHLDVDAYRDYILSRVAEIFDAEGAPLKDGFSELISYLKAQDIRIALATSARRRIAGELFLKKGMRLEDIFDAYVFQEDVEVSKPDPQIFLLAAGGLGLDPGSCLVIEDSLNGIEAARRGGFMPVKIDDLIGSEGVECGSCVLIADSLDKVREYLINEYENDRY